MNIGNSIKKIRTEKAISQKKLSEDTGISRTSLSQIEKGVKRPSQKNLTKICQSLEIPESLVYFYGIEDSDIPLKKRKEFLEVYPTLEGIIKKLLVEN